MRLDEIRERGCDATDREQVGRGVTEGGERARRELNVS